MSAVESAQRAARLTDPIGHGLGLLGMIGGMLLGAVVGAVLLAGAIATGGALLIAVAAFAAVGCVAGGGLAGGQLVRGLQTAMGLPDPQTGVLGPVASLNVRIGNLFAARVTDTAVACDGLMTLMHPIPIPLVPIAEGAQTVKINNLLAARVTSKLVCGAKIKDGEPTVVIGGPTQRVLPVHDPEEELETVLKYAMAVSMIGVIILQPEAIVFIAGFMVVNEAAGEIGDMIGPGWRDILQGALGLGVLAFGGVRGARELGRGPLEGEGGRPGVFGADREGPAGGRAGVAHTDEAINARARNISERTGIPEEDVAAALKHFRQDEHLLADGEGNVRRSTFDRDPNDEALFQKIDNGEPLTADEQRYLNELIRHESREGQILRENGPELNQAYENGTLEQKLANDLEGTGMSREDAARLIASEPKPITPYRYAHIMAHKTGGPNPKPPSSFTYDE
jgi:uncharacterized Zn-binding protein involved in type VI secretion